MSDVLNELTDKIVAIVKERAGDFLEDNNLSKDFLQDRAKRLAKLMIKLAKASENQKAIVEKDIEIVRQSMENELSTLAVNASTEARATFKAVLGTVFEFAQKLLPLVLSAV
jgi:hypothetical protein